MNNPNDNIYAALGVAQNKRVRVWPLDRRACSKSKLHSPPQADRNWKPINAVPTHLENHMEAAHSICIRLDLKHWDLCMGNWNIISLNGKKQELVWEAEQYHLDIVGVPSTKGRGSDTAELSGSGWKLFYSGVDVSMSAQAGIGIFVSSCWAHCVTDWIPLRRRVCFLKLRLQKWSLSILQVYVPNA